MMPEIGHLRCNVLYVSRVAIRPPPRHHQTTVRYVRAITDTLPGLAPINTLVLKLSCESVIENDRVGLRGVSGFSKSLTRQGAKSANSLPDTLLALLALSHIEISPPTQGV